MSLQDVIRGWGVGAKRGWPELLAELPSHLTRAQAGEAHRVIPILAREMTPAFLVGTQIEPSIIANITPLIGQAVHEEQRILPANGPIGFASLALVSAVNAFACVGARVDAQAWNMMRDWLPKLEVSRDDAWTTRYWSSGFAALALESPAAYRRVAAEELGGSAPEFSPGLAFEFNLQALLRYLRAAIQRKVDLEAVTPAWHGFLDAYDSHWQSNSADTRTLFWVGRLVFHHVGALPLGDVARAIHESIWAYAGLDP